VREEAREEAREEKAREQAREEKAREQAREEKEREQAREWRRRGSRRGSGRGGRELECVELIQHVEGEGGRQGVHQDLPSSLGVLLAGLGQFKQSGLFFSVIIGRQELIHLLLRRHNYQHLRLVILGRGLAYQEGINLVLRVVGAARVGLEEAAPLERVAHAVPFRPLQA
jgi:hypothetical protein